MIYGYLCEDAALELFIEAVLNSIGPKTKCKIFQRHDEFCNNHIATPGRNASQVRKLYAEAAKKAVGEFDIDLFIASYDYDDGTTSQYGKVIEAQIKAIDNKARKRSVMVVPVQCVEYWLWYIRFGDDQTSKEQLEKDGSFNRHKAKSQVYDKDLDEKGRYTGQNIETELKKAKAILENLDIEKLKKWSPSFNVFVTQLVTFCNTFS